MWDLKIHIENTLHSAWTNYLDDNRIVPGAAIFFAEALKRLKTEYNAEYYPETFTQPDVGDIDEIIEVISPFIRFEHEEDYMEFMLRWS